MNNPNNRVLLTFIKNPELGKVKTRLAQTVGNERALRIYKSLMEHTRKISEAVSAQRLLFYSEWINNADSWSPEHFEKFLQPEGDLGNRMITAFSKGFEKGSSVVIIGSDCPGLSSELINQAFEHLEKKDFVIGPALDGGYYLIGMRAFEPDVFSNINWSTDTVKSETLAIIKDLDKSVAELPPLSDIDYEADWLKYGWEVN